VRRSCGKRAWAGDLSFRDIWDNAHLGDRPPQVTGHLSGSGSAI
jgi:hypothetical protein